VLCSCTHTRTCERWHACLRKTEVHELLRALHSATQALALLVVVGLGGLLADVLVEDHVGDDPRLEDMIAARFVQSRQTVVHITDLEARYIMYDINGTMLTPADGSVYSYHLPHGAGLPFRSLNITAALDTAYGGMEETFNQGYAGYNAIPLANRSANNLGQQGPNNYFYCYNRAGIAIPSFSNTCNSPQGNYGAHPNFVRMNDVGHFDGKRIGMRIDNTTEYGAAKPAMTDFNGFNFQINLKPLHDISGVSQPFRTGITTLDSFVETLINTTLDAQDMNQVSLFYSFFDQDTGAPVELEEVRTHESMTTHVPTLLACVPDACARTSVLSVARFWCSL
jgi:hypothetical protein